MATDPLKRAVESFWRSRLGVDGQWPEGGAAAFVRTSDDDPTVYGVQRGGGAVLVSVPKGLYEYADRLRERVRDGGLAGLADGDVGVPHQRIFGPAWLGYAEAGDLSAGGAEVSLAELEDRAATLEEMARVCTPEEMSWVASLPHADRALGVTQQGEVVGVAGYRIWDDRIAHLAILVPPEHRRKGIARAAVAAIAAVAEDAGLIPQYRSLVSNRASLGVGQAVGFREFGRMVAIVL